MGQPPKPLDLGALRPASSPAPAPAGRGGPPPLTLPAGRPAATAAPAPAPQPAAPPARPLNMAGANPQLDQLADAVVAADPGLQALRHRVRPRLQNLVGATDDVLMGWGSENLAVATQHSQQLGQVVQQLSQLNVGQWVQRCTEAATRPPARGLLAAFKPQEGPSHYEGRLRQLQAAMAPLMRQLLHTIEEVRPELEDLRLDAAAVGAVLPLYSDSTTQLLIGNRQRTLVQGQQAAAQLVAQAEATRALLVQNTQALDQLLAVTLPAWRLAQPA